MRPLTDAEMKTVLDKVSYILILLFCFLLNPLFQVISPTLKRKADQALGDQKLANYMSDLKSLIAPLEDGDRYVFRLNHSRVYYVKLSIANLATSISRDALLSLGTCLGKMTKTGKFRLHITALPILAAGARHKIWVKENGAQPFLYGSNGTFTDRSGV